MNVNPVEHRSNGKEEHNYVRKPLLVIGAVASVALVGAAIFINLRYKVSTPSQYTVKTGWLIKDVKISKNALQLPFQTVKTFSIEPMTYQVTVNSMSSQRIPFKLPSVWTIGPDISDQGLANGSLQKYVKTIMEKTPEEKNTLMHGIIQGETRKNIANIEAAVTVAENERRKEIAESKKNLQVAEADFAKETNIALAESKAAADNRALELQFAVEINRKKQEIERLRAKDFSAADVAAEIAIRRAEGEAEAIRITSDASLYATQKQADANLAIAEAQAEGLRKLIEAAGGADGLMQYLLIEKNILPQLANSQALAVSGMKPNISIWNTGQSDSTASSTLTDLFKTGMPLLDGIKHQTGFDFLKSAGIQKVEKE